MLGLKPRDQSKVSHFKEVLWVWRDLLKILSWFFSWAFWQFSLKAKRYFSVSNKEKNNYYLPWSCFVQKVKHIRECRSLKQNLSSLFLLWQKWVYRNPCLSLNFCHCQGVSYTANIYDRITIKLQPMVVPLLSFPGSSHW